MHERFFKKCPVISVSFSIPLQIQFELFKSSIPTNILDKSEILMVTGWFALITSRNSPYGMHSRKTACSEASDKHAQVHRGTYSKSDKISQHKAIAEEPGAKYNANGVAQFEIRRSNRRISSDFFIT
jgi:hypothetical protein